MTRVRFEGQIAGLGSTSGVRVVVGHWPVSPFGAFTDVMVEQADGWRVLLAPTTQVSNFVADTYTFDETVVGPVTATVAGSAWRLIAPDLDLHFVTGGRTRLGRLLGLIPRPVATAPPWLTLINPLAKVVMKGVSTRGSAGGGRTEFYGAYDVHSIDTMAGRWRGLELGELADVRPPVHFGFGSTPPWPSLTNLMTTITTTGAG